MPSQKKYKLPTDGAVRVIKTISIDNRVHATLADFAANRRLPVSLVYENAVKEYLARRA